MSDRTDLGGTVDSDAQHVTKLWPMALLHCRCQYDHFHNTYLWQRPILIQRDDRQELNKMLVYRFFTIITFSQSSNNAGTFYHVSILTYLRLISTLHNLSILSIISYNNSILFLPRVALPNIFPSITSWSKLSCLRTYPSHLCFLHQIVFNMLLASLSELQRSLMWAFESCQK